MLICRHCSPPHHAPLSVALALTPLQVDTGAPGCLITQTFILVRVFHVVMGCYFGVLLIGIAPKMFRCWVEGFLTADAEAERGFHLESSVLAMLEPP